MVFTGWFKSFKWQGNQISLMCFIQYSHQPSEALKNLCSLHNPEKLDFSTSFSYLRIRYNSHRWRWEGWRVRVRKRKMTTLTCAFKVPRCNLMSPAIAPPKLSGEKLQQLSHQPGGGCNFSPVNLDISNFFQFIKVIP